jgi:hypothetical protein
MPLPPERQIEIMQEAESHRHLKDFGVRTTNLAAAKDASSTVTRIESEVFFKYLYL